MSKNGDRLLFFI